MATSTTNLGLIKPSGSDKIRIAQINQNSDTLDAAIGAVGATSLQTQVNNVQDALAIIANGDTHAAITAGQFVYVKNNTHSVAEGLHVATANISANGQITTSNVSADASGGLNALNSKFPTKVDKTNMTDGESYTYTSQSAMESGLVSLATTVMGANKVRTIFLYPNFTSQIFGGAAGCATISTGGSSSYFTVLFHNYVTAVHGTYLNGTWSWERIALKSEMTDIVKEVALSASTGSVAANSTAIINIQFTTPAGYKFLTIIPGYTGDDQFCWVGCSVSGNTINATIRNCSSAADSGTLGVKVLFIKE